MAASIQLLRLSLPPIHRHSLTKPPRPTTKPLRPTLRPVPITASYTATPFTDRLISATVYTLPLFNSIPYGNFLISKYPPLASLLTPFLPFLSYYRSVPFLPFIAFFGIYLAVARNTNLSRFVRFNAMQALMLDVSLVLPQLVVRIFGTPRGGVGYKLMGLGFSGVFLFMVLCFVYSFGSSVLGKTPVLPFVADAAGRQLP